jgi:hypothetical protein
MKCPQQKVDASELSFTAGDVKNAAGLSYRQLNDWDSKGALPNSREQQAGWRKFSVRDLFVLMVCSEVRKRYGMPLEKLAWLKSFMMQDGADHFEAAVRMMQYGLAVFIFTDLEESFDMDTDIAIADMLELGYCRYDHPHAYIFVCINPIVNKILAALKKPARLEISDKVYNARRAADTEFRVQDDAELAVLGAMRDEDVKRFTVSLKGDKEILLEIEQDVPEGADIKTAVSSHDFQTVTIKRHQGKNVRIWRTTPKKISREKIRRLVVTKLND